jgi:uncharacterized protein
MPTLLDAGELIVEDVAFRSAGYRLRGELTYPQAGDIRGAFVLAGPHPLLGGNMHNNVVRGVSDGLAQRRCATLRFNYRGVGGSEGPRFDVARHLAEFWATSHVPSEMMLWQDVQAAADFLGQCVGPAVPLALVGYSFGCALLPHVCRVGPPPVRILIAPTVGKHDYDAFLNVGGPILVITSADDFAIDAGKLRAWFAMLPGPKHLVQQRFDNHFFRGYEDRLAAAAIAFFHESLEMDR